MGLLSKNVIISATGNFSTAYNLQIISIAILIAGYVYPETKDAAKTTSSAVKSAALIGAIVGQIGMGYVGDLLGRSRAMALTMSLTILGALLSSINPPYGTSEPGPDITNGTSNIEAGLDKTHSIFVWLTVTRFVLGIGVGGVYPLAATVAAESSESDSDRGKQVSLVFSTQGIGFLVCPLLALLVCAINPSTHIPIVNVTSGDTYTVDCLKTVGDPGQCDPGANDINWRFLLAIGALPGIILLPFKVSETSNVAVDPTRESTFWRDLGRREFWPKLLGTAGGWFLFDIVFYGNNLFKHIIIDAVFKDANTLHDQLIHATYIFAIALPGYWVATALMDRLGRKNIQLFGFGMMFVLYLTVSFLLEKHVDKSGNVDYGPKKGVAVGLLFFLYALTFFFANFGPNSTTFILPSETFPIEVRASLNGFSAACGKTGAAIGTAIFPTLNSNYGTPTLLKICAIVSILGVLVTYFFVEDRRGKSMANSESTMGYQQINSSPSDALLTPLVEGGQNRRK